MQSTSTWHMEQQSHCTAIIKIHELSQFYINRRVNPKITEKQYYKRNYEIHTIQPCCQNHMSIPQYGQRSATSFSSFISAMQCAT